MKIEFDTEKMGENMNKIMQTDLIPKWLKDYFAFRLMIFPLIVKLLYFVGTIFWIYRGICCFQERGGTLFGIMYTFVFPILQHVVLEFFMIFWSMYEEQRTIAAELRAIREELKAKKAENEISE